MAPAIKPRANTNDETARLGNRHANHDNPNRPRIVWRNTIIRRALRSDRVAIRLLVWRAGINPMGLDWRHFYVAEIQGRVIAIGQIKCHADGSRELASIAVTKECRGIGLGSAMVRALVADSQRPLYLMCRPELAGFYERFGFRALPPAGLPPYFRRIRRFVRLWDRVGALWHAAPYEVCIMARVD